MQAWKVYLNDQLITTVFYRKECDHEWVLSSLINHDGYPATIKIYKA